MSSGDILARSMAILAALTPITAVVLPSPFLICLLSFIPVLSLIHSSDVSIRSVKFSLLTMFSGIYIPKPDIFELYIVKSFKCNLGNSFDKLFYF